MDVTQSAEGGMSANGGSSSLIRTWLVEDLRDG